MPDDGSPARSAAWGVVAAVFSGAAIAVWTTANSAASTFPIWPVAPFGLAAITGIYMCFASLTGWWPDRRSPLRLHRTNSVQNADRGNDADLAGQLGITDLFSKTVQQLRSESQEVRLAAIYVLAKIAQDSPRYHQNVMDILCNYIREYSQDLARYPSNDDGSLRTPSDLQAMIQVIGQRNRSYDQYPPDLRRAKLPSLEVQDVDLSNCYLPHADLSRCSFHRVSLEGAQLGWANFEEAHLVDIDLSDALLPRSSFANAYLYNVDLRRADLSNYTDLSGCELYSVRLQDACMEDADLSNTEFHHTDLTGVDFGVTNLSGANLEDTEGLSKEALRSALMDDNTQLPDELCQ